MFSVTQIKHQRKKQKTQQTTTTTKKKLGLISTYELQSITEGSQRIGTHVGTWRQEPKQRPQKNRKLLADSAQAHIRVSLLYSPGPQYPGLPVPTEPEIINQECSRAMPMGQADGGKPFTEDPSSKMLTTKMSYHTRLL